MLFELFAIFPDLEIKDFKNEKTVILLGEVLPARNCSDATEDPFGIFNAVRNIFVT